MIKNVIIAVLVGIIIGQTCKADTAINNGAITRKDLFAAAALCGMLAHSYSHVGPYSAKDQKLIVSTTNYYADKLMQDSPAAP